MFPFANSLNLAAIHVYQHTHLKLPVSPEWSRMDFLPILQTQLIDFQMDEARNEERGTLKNRSCLVKYFLSEKKVYWSYIDFNITISEKIHCSCLGIFSRWTSRYSCREHIRLMLCTGSNTVRCFDHLSKPDLCSLYSYLKQEARLHLELWMKSGKLKRKGMLPRKRSVVLCKIVLP